ncbi:MAG: glycoside hydrolase family 3 C-terminal domain-containing protein [Lachnospiraceae bacterium]|nr:glycoside hydrolase family 3 C-terminal domain-containing protein [Lachnospiraceae bacterium]
MLSINFDDVKKVLDTMTSQLIAIGVIVAVAIIVCIAVLKLRTPIKKLIRSGALIAMVLGIVICVNLIMTGPMKTMLDLISGSGTITQETSDKATELAVNIAEEGIMLLENDGTLPLASGSKLNVFGWASTNPMLGGGGSGALNESYDTVSLLQSLSDSGIETNQDLTSFYTNYKPDRPVVGMWEQDWTLPEPNVSLYEEGLMTGAKEFSDTAMIVISRAGGEGADLPNNMQAIIDGKYQDGTTYTACTYDDSLNEGNDWDAGDHYLQLSNREEEMVDLVCQNFDKVILVYNGMNAFEFGFIKNFPQIKSFIWAPPGGHVGMKAFGEIVTGQINPSAKLPDTMVYELEETPWWNNFGDFNYTNMDDFAYTSVGFTGKESTATPSFVNYVEGIYVGYKFYETAAAEKFIDYDRTVQYPFGYGLSYTTFDQQMSDLTETDDMVEFDVTVTNTGDVAGKDVVQVYSNPPYENGGIEKASANLVQFEKTEIIEPGASETVHIAFSKEELMSYDNKDAKAYVLEPGKYEISINKDSHNKIAKKILEVKSLVKDKASDNLKATNQFDYAQGDIEYLSRENAFANYRKATAAPTNFELSEEYKSTFYNISNYLTEEATAADEDPEAPEVTVGANTGIQLSTLRGAEYDDEKWDAFLDQLTIQEMTDLIALGGYQTADIPSVGKVRTNDCDGPASINNNFTGVGSIGFPIGVVIAATWNKDLAHDFGASIGQMANEMDVAGWYAPAMNNHRTAFAGRNFEYYSEDALLSGYIASQAVLGAQEEGVYAYMKHFALNDQEGNRCDMLCTWTNEQAMREIYLKPFEMCVKLADCHAVMSSFNYIGNRWAGGTSQLCKTVLRDEWGFKGLVETDYFGVYGYMSADQAIRNGTDLCLVNYPTETSAVRFNETNGAKYAMRTATKNILYTVVNSYKYSEEALAAANKTPVWKIIMIVVDVVLGLLLVLLGFKAVKNYNRRIKEGQ